MKNFFFAATEAIKSKLQFAKVAFCDFELDGANGVVVEEGEVSCALEVIGARVIGKTLSSLDGIVTLALRAETDGTVVAPIEIIRRPQAVFVETANIENCRCDHWRELMQNVSEWMKKNVTGVSSIVHYGYERTPIELRSGWLNVVLGSEIAGGFEDGPGVVYVPGQKLISFSKLPDCPEKKHFSAIVDSLFQLLPLLLATGDEVEVVRQRLAEERRKKSREQYIAECSKRFEKTVKGTIQAISDGKNEIARLQQALVKKIREVNGAERKLEQLFACKGGELDKYGREYDKLLAVPKVRDVQVADGVVKMFTDTLFCKDPRTGKTHEIGAFRIEIFTSNGDVRWYNLTRQIDGYSGWGKCNAPHVNASGQACLGTMAEIIPELVANYEFSALAMVAIQFVESVNTDDAAGKYISNWPVAQTGKEA